MATSDSGLTFRPFADGRLLPLADVVLGCAPSAGLYLTPTSAADAVALFHEAARLGLGGLDTAPLYGCGRSEIDISRAFAADPELMSRLAIVTKTGRRCEPEAGEEVARLDKDAAQRWRVERDDRYYSRDRDTGHLVCVADYSSTGVRRSLDASEARLGRAAASRISTLRLHDVESDEKFTDLTTNGGLEALAALRAEGRVKSVGLGMNSPPHVLRVLQHCDEMATPVKLDSVLLAGAWNLMERNGRGVLQHCKRGGIGVHIAGVFGAGLLWGAKHYRYASAGPVETSRRDALESICRRHGVPLPWLALHFSTRPKCVTKLVIGCRTVAELRACVALLKREFPSSKIALLYAELERAGLLERRDFVAAAEVKARL